MVLWMLPCGTLHVIPGPEKVLSEIRRVLKNDGFEVKQSRQFASTIPLLYTECIAEKE